MRAGSPHLPAAADTTPLTIKVRAAEWYFVAAADDGGTRRVGFVRFNPDNTTSPSVRLK